MGLKFRFAIAAAFTAEPLEPAITFWGRQLNLDVEVRFAPFNQIEQTLLDNRGEFASNTSGVNVIALRVEDFGSSDPARLSDNVDHFLHALAHAKLGSPTIVCICPPSAAFLMETARSEIATRLTSRIAAAVMGPGLHFLGHRAIAEYYPVADYEAGSAGQMGAIPYNETYYTALATALARRAHVITRPEFKVIALDCDDTLWSGLCGEDGPSGITLDEPRRELQRFMLRQRESGALLAIASKNNQQDVIEAFEQHPEMPLALRDFTAWRINWQSKADNLAELAKELNVGLDSFIFVDDNPKECAEVESSVPETLSVALPADVSLTADFLRHIWAFDRGAVTAEDRKRTDYMAQGMKFGAELRKAASLREFLARLELDVRIAKLQPQDLARVAQLTQRTNQFNCTGVRRPEVEIKRLLDEGGCECFAARVSDRFGDYGLTGAVLVFARGGEFVIDTFVLSCRVLGRGVEHRVMAFLAAEARTRGLTTIAAHFVRTPKNAPAQQFLDSLGGIEGSCYKFPVERLIGRTWKPDNAARTEEPVNGNSSGLVELKHARPDYVRIARTLSKPADILAAIRREGRGAGPVSASLATETEGLLAELWTDLLRVPSVSASDNFFGLGGHWLLVVLLLERIHEAFGVELPVDDVYSGGLTLAELAQRIDVARMGGEDSAEYAELLREIEALSDEEARQLLAEGDPPRP